jgi:hypothetical protein
MTEYIKLTGLERLIIWLRRNNVNFSKIDELLGITRM